MGTETGIQWTTHSWNPWQGCHKVSAGCKNCYMYRDKERYGQDPSVVVRSAPATFNAPLRTGKHRWLSGSKVFTCSWSDWFIEEADPWRAEAWAIVRRRPDLTFQILTKRPERIAECLPDDWDAGYPNVWLGTSVENQEQANIRVRELVQIPAQVTFLSSEPLLGPVVIPEPDVHLVDWVIVGGESGPRTGARAARPCALEWVRNLVRQCGDLGIPVFVKQLGSYAGLRDGHGGDPLEWPSDLRVRQWPQYRQWPQ